MTEALVSLLRGKRVVALTGAGVSTESGIPDYRSPAALARPRRPIQGPEFVRSAALRRRYWARAMVGWTRFRAAEPNDSHHALATLERSGAVVGLITQNVDRLHHKAGSRKVVELHGALADVVCLECGRTEERDDVQARMRSENPGWIDGPVPLAPDGDAELPDALVERFVPPACHVCGGALKPDVVFFGHNVAKPVVDRAFALLDEAEALLVAGTSLAVFSGYRFLVRAAERGMPIAIVNRGPVRGEERAHAKLDAPAGEALSALAHAIARV
ncbi:MAG: NAD-dependent protein deacetylase [Labilithrix sp.]|nr:NAD-dependent protein deacetylase [Labilithrix sp.]MCW5815820.1 NAD-dependent protein deacetylase [Labilithrix sp.]